MKNVSEAMILGRKEFKLFSDLKKKKHMMMCVQRGRGKIEIEAMI